MLKSAEIHVYLDLWVWPNQPKRRMRYPVKRHTSALMKNFMKSSSKMPTFLYLHV